MGKIKLGSKSMLYPYPATILTTVVDGKKNYMQVGFAGIVNANPGMVAMGIGKHHLTTKALLEGEVIGLAIVNEPMLLKADYVGIRSGAKVDKSEVFETFSGDYGAVLIEESPINLELKVIRTMDLGGVDVTVIAEILQVYADENIMTGNNPDIVKMNPVVLSMYENQYFTLGENVGRGWNLGFAYEKLELFVRETIFQAFDKLEDLSYFKKHIIAESKFQFDGETYVGYEGFSLWYKQINELIEKEGLAHIITNFDAKKLQGNQYEVSFDVEMKATTKSGEKINHFVKERWILKEEEGTFAFLSYLAQ